jgi:hypothetical protein
MNNVQCEMPNIIETMIIYNILIQVNGIFEDKNDSDLKLDRYK